MEIKCKQVVGLGVCGLMQQITLSLSHPTYHNIASFYFIHALKKVKSSVNPLKSKICTIYKDEIKNLNSIINIEIKNIEYNLIIS